MQGLNRVDTNRDSMFSGGAKDKERETKRLMIDSIYTPQNFTFDKIYGNIINSQTIYKDNCRNIVKSVISGYNGTNLKIILRKYFHVRTDYLRENLHYVRNS